MPAAATGHQLAVQADDPSGTVDALRRFYGALFNGGCVNDQVHYNFGNEPDGWYYGGASWMKGLPLLAGAPAPDAAASRPHDLAAGLPRQPADDRGHGVRAGAHALRLQFGGHGAVGAYTDDNIIQIIGGRAYYLYSGDLAFVRQQLPFYRRAVAWYLGKRNADGLVSLTPAHWYYDAMLSSGVTTYHNAFLYRALLDLAELERAAGNDPEAATRETEAARLKDAINRVLWWEDAPGGPRYVDWIQPDGTKIAYAADLCQFPPVAFGIASPEQAKKLLATLDRRIAELERDHGYARPGVAVRVLARAGEREHASGQPGLRQLHERRLVPLHDLLGGHGPLRGGRCRRGLESPAPVRRRHAPHRHARLHRQQLGDAGRPHRFRRERRAVSLRRDRRARRAGAGHPRHPPHERQTGGATRSCPPLCSASPPRSSISACASG